MRKSNFSGVWYGATVHTLWLLNKLKITYCIFEINSFLYFSKESTMAAKTGENCNFNKEIKSV